MFYQNLVYYFNYNIVRNLTLLLSEFVNSMTSIT